MTVVPNGENKIKLVVTKADPVGVDTKDHGHDEIPKDAGEPPAPSK